MRCKFNEIVIFPERKRKAQCLALPGGLAVSIQKSTLQTLKKEV